jgi:two-component system chemotaxis sensor kinase CheA
MVLNPADLIASLQRRPNASVTSNPVPELGSEAKKVILLAEDSITTRTQEKRILEAAGYEVVTAVDGADAFVKLRSRPFDAVVSDVEMPNMTGLQLAERIRQEPKHNELPIILVTSLATDEDRKRGVEVGANAYITKGTFDQRALLDILKKLV